MNDDNRDLRRAVALFRFGVIADVMTLAPRSREMASELQARANRAWAIPGTRRTRVAEQTIRDWVRLYREGGFDALMPKRRIDRGKPRRMSVETIELLLAIKRDAPGLSVREVIGKARQSGEVEATQPLPPSTVHRLFSREGLMDRPVTPAQDRRRYQHRFAGDLWQSDVMYGPHVGDGRGRRRRTYLIAFLDDATRLIPYAAFAFAESTTAFLPVLKQALLRRGRPLKLYCDNGANFRSTRLSVICARLNIALIHAKPFSPAGKGKIERYFRTTRSQLVNRFQDDDLRDLETLNSRLWAWIEGEYHRTPHRGLDGMTPLDKWAASSDNLRLFDPGFDLDEVFLAEAVRRVNRDRTVSLHNHLYEVDAALIGQKVVLRYDPDTPPSRPIRVVHDGKEAGCGTALDSYANSQVKRTGAAIPFHTFDRGDG